MSPADSGQPGNDLLVNAYNVAHHTTNMGKAEKKVDGIVENLASKTESPTLSFLNDFYNDNKATISTAAAGFASIDNKTIENVISKFTETAKVVMNGLDALAAVHPFVGVAVVAFKLVVTLDLTRRENNQKVMAIRVQMQDTMCILFQLRHMKDPEEQGADGITIKDRMQPLIEKIAKSIQECGSACDAYLKKSFLSRTLKCKVYESRLATWASAFADYRSELERALAVHTAVGVDQANRKLDKQQTTLKNIEGTMLEIFRKLDTPKEREVAKFMDENGGARACIEKDDLLTKLISKSGESISSVAQRSTVKGGDDVATARKALLKELTENVDEIFKKNLVVFEAKMAIQRQQITEVMEKQGQQIMSVLLSGSHERIRDADLQRLWKDMGWKGSVKARHFVLALRDYFTDRFNESTFPTTPQISATGLPRPSPDDFTHEEPGSETVDNPINPSDRWTLGHLNVTQLQPILEAIDDDGTGFISIKEANTFAIQRPKGWTLLRWLAFWAKGWHHSLSKYKNQIYLFVQEMHQDLEYVKPDNRFLVDWYLDGDHFRTIEQLVRSTNLPDENEQLGAELSHITDSYVKSEEERLERNLKSVGYNIDSPATVSLITGHGRIERHVYPLLFLVLRHHVRIIKAAREHIIHIDELNYWAESLTSIVTVLKYRMEAVGGKSIYRQTYADVKVRLENFAFGMFRLIWESPDSWRPADNSFAAWEDISTDRDESQIEDYDEEDLRLLHFPNQDTFSYKSIDIDMAPFQMDSNYPSNPIGLEGLWTGHCYHTDPDGDRISIKGLMMIRITGSAGEPLDGKVESCSGVGDVTVTGDVHESQDAPCNLTLTLYDEQGGSSFYRLSGEDIGDDGTGEGEESGGDTFTFILKRTPPELYKFRYSEEELEQNAPQARWTFACRAVLFYVRKKRWAWAYLKDRMMERRRVIELRSRAWHTSNNMAPDDSLTKEELKELDQLDDSLPPSMSGLFHALLLYSNDRESYLFDCSRWHRSVGCSYCEKSILQPGYKCLQCISPDHSTAINLSRDTFICSDCDTNNREVLMNGPAPQHDLSHIIVRIFDTNEENFERDASDKTIQRLEGLEKALQARVYVLEEGLKTLEKKMDGYFGSLENLLKGLTSSKTMS
ncbi:hypothetical protein AN958_06143 [Leucoagaricus sp. SymC.cos]|nr:hypothetical protein AN958_06143 [Leucoagaricus sp. SymC.cos]